MLGIFAPFGSVESHSVIMEGTGIPGQSLRQWQKFRLSQVTVFFRHFHRFIILTKEFCLESPAVCFVIHAEESEPLAALRDGVLVAVFFLCIKSYAGNITYLKRPRSIQSLDASRGCSWQDKCLQRKITFPYTQYLFSRSET